MHPLSTLLCYSEQISAQKPRKGYALHFTTQYLRYSHGFILEDTGTPSRLGRRSGGYNQLAQVSMIPFLFTENFQ